MKFRHYSAITMIAIGCVMCSTAAAETWNFSSGGSGNSAGMTFTSVPAGVTVTATAWYVNGSSLLKKGTLGQYSAGLGACNPNESCSSPEHQVDNKGQLEFILFQFSQNLTNISFTIDPSPDSDAGYVGNVPDRDVTYWAGTPTLGANLLADVNFATLGTLFTAGHNDVANSDGGTALTIPLTTVGGVSSVLFGPRDTLNGDDFFKISGMSGQKFLSLSPVPEPTSIALLFTVVVGAAFAVRKKHSASLEKPPV